MKDDHYTMEKFVKIVERFPSLYDSKSEHYGRGFSIENWKRVAEAVQTEMNQPCNTEELKNKWKGVRSSYARYKTKLLQEGPNNSTPYYLYKSLTFLDPFVKSKTAKNNSNNQHRSNISEESLDGGFVYNSDDEGDNEETVEVKPKISEMNFTDIELPLEDFNEEPPERRRHKRKRTTENPIETEATEDDSEDNDLLFFKSLLPDIKHFTSKEKRKLKVRILQLIDVIEGDRSDVNFS
ncbi:hypothetical protein JYU34_006567 [Plutella xylostella]|uniref:Uncharacterized protein n=2 Tax=Plutella xylostella TaxID=51655 RepID=A0ABQ7QSE2_PLUXY|nr:uncharacterized protein LOC105389227 [Plutella xylostella]KAG7307948.1 hypothetical protein JYU34_006567 [Plutella xylostella]CAG9134382.1 unnamed protein product [Plutella xylostella]